MPRHNWKRKEIKAIYQRPFLDLVFDAQTVHRRHFRTGKIERATLLSLKSGRCEEDCYYCPQSARYKTSIDSHPLLLTSEVLKKARKAQRGGSSRFCMGASWRQVREGAEFDQILEIVRVVSKLGMEVCCTLGMLNESQARRLKESGLTTYNHNLDTSPEFYGRIITTRTYEDRLRTLEHVRKAGIKVCCGGIIGMGESVSDRAGLLQNLANQNPHPEYVPINMLVSIKGTPLEDAKETDPIELVRTIATARIIMPKSTIRLSAGRASLSDEAQTLAFLAGANSIFSGEKLLTTPNRGVDEDERLFQKLGLKIFD